MQKVLSIIKFQKIAEQGMSLVEVVLAVGIFAVISTGVISSIIYGQESTAVAGARERAVKIAEEGIDAVRNIRDSGYVNLPVDGTYGLVISGGVWNLSGVSDITDIFTRTVTLSTIDARTRDVVVYVTWTQTVQRVGSISLNAQFSDWVTPQYRKGMLVYGDGGTTSDAIKYQIYSDSNSAWSVAAATADVDVATTNKYLRNARIYSSSTRDEKVLITRHFDGTRQWFYSQVYNGVTGTWGNVNALTNFASTTNNDTQKFDGVYLANGDFMVLYMDNTNIPKFKIWNGTIWSTASGVAGTSTQNIGGIASYVTLKQRPGTNEAMAVFFDQSSDTNSQYFWIGANGTYETADWVLSTEHSASAPSSAEKYADFSWSSSDNTKGAIIYTSSNADKAMNIRIWTANGLGSGSWGATANYTTNQQNNIGALSIAPIVGTNLFLACNKDTSGPSVVSCIRANTTGWVAGSSSTISNTTDGGVQLSFNIGFEQLTPVYGVNIYSDNTGIAKYKKYNISTLTWDVSPISINSTAVGVTKTTKAVPNPISNDMMLFVSDNNRDLYSIAWDGTSHIMYSAPVGKAWLVHGINGSAITDFWYDFAWDGM